MSGRILIQIVLWVFFIYAISGAIRKLYMVESNTVISFSDDLLPFPTFTICPENDDDTPVEFYPGSNATLIEFFNTAKFFSERITSVTLYNGNEYKNEFDDSLDGNITLEDFVIPGHFQEEEPYIRLITCTNINIQKDLFSPSTFTSMFVSLDMSNLSRLAVERHSPGMSRMSFIWNEETIIRLKRGKSLSATLGVTKHSHLNTPRKLCHEEAVQFQDCLNGYIEDKLGCLLPWTTSEYDDWRLCDEIEDLTGFFNLYELFNTDSDTLDELKHGDFKCLVPNCLATTWPIIALDDLTSSNSKEDNESTIEILLPSGLQAQEIIEVPAYGFASFVADFGGYLGLLLGASVLSLFDYAEDLIKSAFKKCNKV